MNKQTNGTYRTEREKVGLRWWSNVKEDGTTEWVFESLEDMSEINSADYKLFWIGLYGTPVLWVGLLITGIMLLKFQWLVIVVIALLLSGANIYGYTKCNADAKVKASLGCCSLLLLLLIFVVFGVVFFSEWWA